MKRRTEIALVIATIIIRIYSRVMKLTGEANWKQSAPIPETELCKEPHAMRRAVGIKGVNCNCLQ